MFLADPRAAAARVTTGRSADLYTNDPDSSYHQLKPSSPIPYEVYVRKLSAHVGERRVDSVMGRDVIRWHKV
jgi:hypothetical protein